MPLLGPNGQPLSEFPPPDAMPVDEATSAPSEAFDPTAPIPCITAMVIYQLPNGLWQLSDDLDVPLMPERKIQGDDVTGACAVIGRDSATREFVALAGNQLVPSIVQNVVQNVIQAQIGAAQAFQQQAENKKIALKVEQDKQRRGGR